MAIPVYLSLTDSVGTTIQGSVSVVGREGSIEVVALEHAVTIPTDDSSGKLTGTRIHQALAFTKEVDASSVYFYKAVTTGNTLKTAVLDYYRINDNGQETKYFTQTLTNVKVVKVALKMHDAKDPAKSKHTHLDEVELRYEKISWKYVDGNIEHSDAWDERALGAASAG
ncbi:type VI secretion system tube protein TssD [Pseudomonas sp. dw_358]|uniref:type VI secretion system tube protein TssD n=1 Tax=Pseudomonas sp. dw_358 TaxID=2720083 RepID=UPI001BD45A38|nr:type VI secretion system tube protein TssD [Pseudomonas sp. dw_358]